MSYSDQCGLAAGGVRGMQSPLSEEQIKKYLEILHNYTKNISDKPKCNHRNVQIVKIANILQ